MEQIHTANALNQDEEPPLISSGVIDCTPYNYQQSSYKQQEKKNSKNSPRSSSEKFRKTYFPNTSKEMWNNWHWQLAHRITTLFEISRFLHLSEEEDKALQDTEHSFPFAITPYYLSLLDLRDTQNGLRKTIIPSIRESFVDEVESIDPLHEENTSPVPCIIHRYPDRVLFLTTSFCSTYCRYCTRSRMVGGHDEVLEPHWKEAIEYIRETEAIRDVIISGGDPLTLSDEKIEWLLKEITSIDHIEMVRIGTKVPTVMPQRITPKLIKILKRYKPIYMSIHATHPDEITKESSLALNRLSDAGVVLGSQTVLLKGVNDSVEILMSLFHKLLKVRVKPYYLYQCDPIIGSAHFRTTVDKGKELIQGLRGFTSGYAIPQYVIDTPGGGGKVPILPDYQIGRDEKNLYLRNYEGKVFAYPLGKEE
ncbi:MAG: KamA family radical SAM protein [Spirochaetia bacterium]|nr:KamA family radical SAM protein [Spirochaetia bacterium]